MGTTFMGTDCPSICLGGEEEDNAEVSREIEARKSRPAREPSAMREKEEPKATGEGAEPQSPEG